MGAVPVVGVRVDELPPIRGTAVGASQIRIIPEIGHELSWEVDDVFFKEIAGIDGERHVFLHFVSKYPVVEDPDDGRD